MSALRVAARFSHVQVQVPAPIIQQSLNFSCGSGCLLSALHYWLGENLGKIEREADLWKGLAIDPESGAEAVRIAAVARHFGLKADVEKGMGLERLRGWVRRGATVILCIQAWQETPAPWETDWDHGHYVLCVGMDGVNATFMDPEMHTAYGWMPEQELPRRWHSPDLQNRPEYGVAIPIMGDEPKGTFPGLPIRMK